MVRKDRFWQILIHTFLLVLSGLALAPLILLLASSLTAEDVLNVRGYRFLPRQISFESYYYLFASSGKILRGLGISVFVTTIGTIMNGLMTFLFAYPLSQKRTPCRGVFTFLVFFSMLFNGGLVPTYMMYANTLHIKDTIWALIIPSYLFSGFSVILLKSFFVTSIPGEIIDAAKIDGAGEYRVLFRIVFPLSKPIIATLGFMTALVYWNDWTNSLYYITDSRFLSLQGILNSIMGNLSFLSTDIRNLTDMPNIPSIGIRMAIAVVGVLPILCIYPLFQRYFIKGITLGGVKG